MAKLTTKQRQTITQLCARGRNTSRLAKEFGVTTATIKYHTNQKHRKKVIEDSKKRVHERYATTEGKEHYKTNAAKYREKHPEYYKQYQFKRYHTDQEFRKKAIERTKKSRRKRERGE